MNIMPLDSSPHARAEVDESEFCGFATDAASRAELANLAARNGWPAERVFDSKIGDAIQFMAGAKTPKLIIIDLSGADAAVAAVNALAEVCDEGTGVIVLGDVNDISLYRDLMAIGVDDYLVKPIDAHMLDAAVERTNKPADEKEPVAAAGQVTVVLGARGGVGASTVAVNTAWILANEQNRRVALVDFDLRFGTAALALDLEPGRGLAEALRNPGRIDGLFIERAMVKESEYLFVLAAEESLDDPMIHDSGAHEALIGRMRDDFVHVVIDIPRRAAVEHKSVLAAADTIVIVTDLSLAGLRDCIRLRQFAAAVQPGARIIMTANRVGADKKAEIGAADFAGGIECALDHSIPMDAKALARSTTTGKAMPAAAKDGPAVTAFRALALDIGGVAETAKPPLWRRLLVK